MIGLLPLSLNIQNELSYLLELLVTSENCSFVTLRKINSRCFREEVTTFKVHLTDYSNNGLLSFQVFHFGYHST